MIDELVKAKNTALIERVKDIALMDGRVDVGHADLIRLFSEEIVRLENKHNAAIMFGVKG